MNQPRISQLISWENHEINVREVLLLALASLPGKVSTILEDEISRQLFFAIRQANCELLRAGRGLLHPITYQGQNPPHVDDISPAKREKKKPDFYWALINPDEVIDNPLASERQFVIECKRLGKRTKSGNKLNEDYVKDGIVRFVLEEYGYAKGEKTGVMVGYIQNMQLDDILDEVNEAIKAASLPDLDGPFDGWKIKGTSHLGHTLIRTFKISPFYLEHYWVDLRDS